jgi:DNA-binding SARP family transcriptional activator/tetratricopeptide (TPR) repeat protein
MLQVSLLGERTVTDEATGEVRSRSSRTLALIAYLAVHAGAPQPRGRIAATFWPASPEQQALTNLRRELHQLRRIVDGDESLLVTGTDLTWRDRDTCQVDLRDFQRARERTLAAAPGDAERILEHGQTALAAFRGELLPGLYDDWTVAERDRLTVQCVELCALVADAGRRTGRWSVALAAARRRVELAPLEEAGHRDLIRLHARHGDRAAAVSAYHRCATLLDQELGIEPDAETQQLLTDLVDAVPSRSPAAAETVVASVGFVGRRDELNTLTAVMDEAFTGKVRAVLVVGEPGVGKTRLVDEAARAARRRGGVVATAQCYGAPGRLALAPVAEWLTEPTLAAGVASLPPVWRTEVERLVPRSDRGSPSDRAGGLADAWQRYRFYQGLAQGLRVTDRPLLLVLDNLQWCDEETLDFLAFVVGAEPTAPLMLALTARGTELGESRPHGEWIRRLRASGTIREITLTPFGEEETGELLRQLTGRDVPDEVARVAVSATGGFPLYVVEAARHRAGAAPRDDAPADLDAVLRARFDQLGDGARQVAELAAAIGRDFDLELLCEASDLGPDAVVRAVDELWRLRILHETRRGYDFSHDLLRDTAYEQVSPPARWLLHRRLAQALELLHAGRTDKVAAQLADQYARAGNGSRSLEYYHRAAEAAARVFAHAEAIHLHQAALRQLAELPDGIDRDLLEIRTLTSMSASLNAHRGYSDPELARTLERTGTLAERLSLRDTLMDALVGLWSSRFVSGDIASAHALATRAVAIADGGPVLGGLSGQAHFAYAGSALSLGMPAAAREHFELACARSDDEQSLSTGSHPAIHARAWSAHAAWLLGERDRAAAHATEAVERARSVDHPYSLAITLGYAALTWQLLGDIECLEEATGELARLGARHGFAYYPAWGLVLSGWARDDAAGTARIERGLADLRAAGAFARMPYWLSLLAARVTDPGRARAVLDAAVVAARVRQDRWWLPDVLRVRATRFATGSERSAGVRAALDLALEQGSVALAERCRADLAAPRTPGERPLP